MIASKLQMVPSTDKIMFPVIKAFNIKKISVKKLFCYKSLSNTENNNKQNKYDIKTAVLTDLKYTEI